MVKFLIFFLITFNVYAAERVVPLPDIAERGEMECFDVSQVFHKILTNIQDGADPELMVKQIKLNNENAKKASELEGVQRTRYFAHIDRITQQAIKLIDLSKKIDMKTKPEDAQEQYYDFCVIAFNKRLAEYKKLNSLAGSINKIDK